MPDRLLLIGTLGPMEWVIILVVVLILFGGRKIPQLAKDLGSGIREFRKSLSGATEGIASELEKDPAETESNQKPTSRKSRS